MPGLIRKLVLIAAVEGLIIQPHPSLSGAGERSDSQALRLDYKTRKITPWNVVAADAYKKVPHLESHGIIGILNVASYSYLISVTRREQVAQIFGKSIYVITDVSLLPLSSKLEAEKEIRFVHSSGRKTHSTQATTDSETSDDDLDVSDVDEVEERSISDQGDVTTPSEHERQLEQPSIVRSDSKTSVAEDVIARKGQYGRVATIWLTRKTWGARKKEAGDGSSEPLKAPDVTQQSTNTPGDKDKDAVSESRTVASDAGEVPTIGDGSTSKTTVTGGNTQIALLPKLLRTTRQLFASRSFFFSYEIDLTQRFGQSDLSFAKPPLGPNLQSVFFWNQHLAQPLVKENYGDHVLPLIQGFVGQKAFVVKSSSGDSKHTTAAESLNQVLMRDQGATAPKSDEDESFLLTLISRRSSHRAGLRYLRRGIDDRGDVANFVETEQIISSPTWDARFDVRSFVQIRGSIPLYFSQSPYSFKPLPVVHHAQEVNDSALQRHFQKLIKRYGKIQVAQLTDKHGSEVKIGEEYQAAVERFNSSNAENSVDFEWFDFHSECRGMKFENVSLLINKLAPTIAKLGENVISSDAERKLAVLKSQTGIVRTNCMDCLDRTNVVQSAFAQHVLEKALRQLGFEIDFLHDPSTQWFNGLWADNGDAISKLYASTAALKGDFTRTRKRDYRGMVNDFGLTLSRYYSNTVNDYFSQTVIDFLLGNISDNAFDDFEANMINADPGISIYKIRQNAIDTCRKIVVQDSSEDFCGGWIMLSPSQPNTLRTLPFEESVVLLTDAALYHCRFDWTTEKVASFEKAELRSIKQIVYGTYITSTLTQKQIDEKTNVGLVIQYQQSDDNVLKVNTRSLQSEVDLSRVAKSSSPPSGTPRRAWLTGRDDSASGRLLALKMSPSGQDPLNPDARDATTQVREICEEIQRAVLGHGNTHLHEPDALLEHTDIISLAEAKKRTGYLEQVGYQLKRFIWA